MQQRMYKEPWKYSREHSPAPPFTDLVSKDDLIPKWMAQSCSQQKLHLLLWVCLKEDRQCFCFSEDCPQKHAVIRSVSPGYSTALIHGAVPHHPAGKVFSKKTSLCFQLCFIKGVYAVAVNKGETIQESKCLERLESNYHLKSKPETIQTDSLYLLQTVYMAML